MKKLGSAEASKYRRDIDGLRAIAVASVIFYHVNKNLLPGGFVGVDVFFVISGFLISYQIFGEMDAGRFSIVEFYRRRIKRIAPAMLAVVGVTLLATQLLLIPDDAEIAAEAAFFSIFSLANLYFWKFLDASYFAESTDQQPFLHLWSLGVEEQFYIVWPLVLMLAYGRCRPRVFGAICAAVAVVAFALGDLTYPRDPSFAYYMLPTRAGELLLGALSALVIRKRNASCAASRTAGFVAAAGLGLLVASLFLTNEDQPYPGWRALPPTIGASMLIVAGHYRVSAASLALCWTPLTFLGVISYSAYLWHWPILAFLRYFGIDIGPIVGTAAVVGTLGIAWLSYRFIEQPARRSVGQFRAVALKQFVVPAAALSLFCVVAKLSDGYFPRMLFPALNDTLRAAERETQPAFESTYICQRSRIRDSDLATSQCIVGAPAATEPAVILWGDSNASHYVGMLATFAKSEGYAFRNVAAAGCPPLLRDVGRVVNPNKLIECSESSAAVGRVIRNYPTIWIAADWLTYSRKSQNFLPAFRATIQELHDEGRRVVLIGKAPVISRYDRRCRQKSIVAPGLRCQYDPQPLLDEVVQVNKTIEDLANSIPGVLYFDANRNLCPDGICPLIDDRGRLRYYDSTHLSLDASWRLGELVEEAGVPAPFLLQR